MAVAGLYDALISRRCYKILPDVRAKARMHDLRDTTFDPVVLEAFLASEAEVLQIAARFRDERGERREARVALRKIVMR